MQRVQSQGLLDILHDVHEQYVRGTFGEQKYNDKLYIYTT